MFAASMILAGFLMLSGLLLIWHSTRDWATTEATIRKFDCKQIPGRNDQFWYTLLYEFSVDGQNYTGEMISPRHSDYVLSQAESSWYASQLQPGRIVPVTYFPDQPGDHSFIENVTISDIAFTPCGTLLLGLWILYLLRKNEGPTGASTCFSKR